MPEYYKKLTVWQKSMDLVVLVYQLTARFPAHEKYGLTNQLRRAAVSIASNIAEGQGRLTAGEFKQFLSHARGSLNEVDTQLIVALRLNYLSEEDYRHIETLLNEVARLLNGLINSVTGLHAKEEETSYEVHS